MKDIKFKKRGTPPAWLVAVICVVVCSVIVAVGFVALKNAVSSDKEKDTGYSFSTEGFENVADVKCLNEEMAVFTDKSSGFMGIMTLSGEITEKAQHTKISVCSDAWRNYRYVVETPLSEYLLLVDTASKTVTNRQYHGLTEPELVPCWSEAGNHLAWTDEKGYAGEIKSGELNIDQGLYPVSNSLDENAKWGFINAALQREIPFIFENAGDFSCDLAPAKKDGKWGYINKNGATAIGFEYESCAGADSEKKDMAFKFKNNLAPVCKNEKFGIINTKGETVVDFSFESILQGENGVYIACRNGKWGLITVAAKNVATQTVTQTQEQQGEVIARGNYKVKTSGSVLNLRKTASADAVVIGKIPNGTELTVTKIVAGWAYVTYNSMQGWVSSDYLAEIETTSSNN